jgi:hypothetical protein
VLHRVSGYEVKVISGKIPAEKHFSFELIGCLAGSHY